MSEDDFQRLRERVHSLADKVQAQALQVAEHGILIVNLTADITEVERSMATSEQLTHAVRETHLKLDHLHDCIHPIKRALWYAVGLLASTVFLAILSLVLKK